MSWEKIMKKSKFLIITAILVIVTITAALFAGCVKKAMGAEGDLDFDGLASAPTQEARAKAQPVDKSKITLSDTMTEDQAVLDSIESEDYTHLPLPTIRLV